MENIEKCKTTGLFTNYIYKAIPLAFDESMSYYETLCGLLNYLKNTVIPTVNNNADAVIELQNLYTQLKNYVDNYFTNLDVQDEINNKLDEMVNDGTLENVLKSIIEYEPNKNFHVKMGTTSLFYTSSTNGEKELKNFKKYFDGVCQMIRMTFDTELNEWIYADANFNEQITVFNNWYNEGNKIDALKFYQTSVNWTSLLTEYGIEYLMTKYLNKIYSTLDLLNYKDEINTIYLLNEAGPNLINSDNSSTIVTMLNTLKASGYLVSTPLGNVYALIDQDQDIINANSFITLNLYPSMNIYGERTTIKQMAERYNRFYNVIEPYIGNKNLVIGEFGCSASWSSFEHPSSYQDDHDGKPISLMIEGFFQSKFVSRIQKCYFWYYGDAIKYAPDTLLSIKNNSEVRYDG